MALPFVLSFGLRRAMPFIERGIALKLSGNAINRALIDSGIGIQRQNLLDYIRWVKGEEPKKAAIRSLRRDLKPNADRIREAITRIRRNYSYKVEYSGLNPQSGEYETRWINIATDMRLSPMQAESIAEDTIEADRDNYPIQIDKVFVVDIVKAGTAGTLT